MHVLIGDHHHADVITSPPAGLVDERLSTHPLTITRPQQRHTSKFMPAACLLPAPSPAAEIVRDQPYGVKGGLPGRRLRRSRPLTPFGLVP
jgi:hypothetical protein